MRQPLVRPALPFFFGLSQPLGTFFCAPASVVRLLAWLTPSDLPLKSETSRQPHHRGNDQRAISVSKSHRNLQWHNTAVNSDRAEARRVTLCVTS